MQKIIGKGEGLDSDKYIIGEIVQMKDADTGKMVNVEKAVGIVLSRSEIGVEKEICQRIIDGNNTKIIDLNKLLLDMDAFDSKDLDVEPNSGAV